MRTKDLKSFSANLGVYRLRLDYVELVWVERKVRCHTARADNFSRIGSALSVFAQTSLGRIEYRTFINADLYASAEALKVGNSKNLVSVSGERILVVSPLKVSRTFSNIILKP